MRQLIVSIHSLCHVASSKARRLGNIALGVTSMAVSLTAMAQEPVWPAAQLIKLSVPFSSGGSTDSIGCLLATEMAIELNLAVVVESDAGANGNIETDFVAKAPADSCNLLLSGIGSNAISYGLYKLNYSNAAFHHLSMLAPGPQVIVVNNDIPAQSLQELVKLAKSELDARMTVEPKVAPEVVEGLRQTAHTPRITHKGNLDFDSTQLIAQLPSAEGEQSIYVAGAHHRQDGMAVAR